MTAPVKRLSERQLRLTALTNLNRSRINVRQILAGSFKASNKRFMFLTSESREAGTQAGRSPALRKRLGLTVGYVLWTIRGGWLLTSLLAQMPAWRMVDPLVVLNYLDEESENTGESSDDEEDDSLEGMLEKSESEDQDPGQDFNETDEVTHSDQPERVSVRFSV
jgi:hypothetical protein